VNRPLPSLAPPFTRTASLVDAETRDRIENAVRDLLDPTAARDSRLAAAVAETLAHPGSLWRAELAWTVARACGQAEAEALAVAAAIESFHTASLLFDDLPAMDDSRERRGRPCVHRELGDAAAMLAALAFVHRGYARLWQAFERAPVERRRRAAEMVEACLGLGGILDGQARDVHFEPRGATAREVLEIAAGKTVTLLRLTLVLPALLAGAAARELALLERLAEAWGVAYQILDDLSDPVEVDGGDDLRHGRPNLVHVAGRRAASRHLANLLAAAAAARASLTSERPALAAPFARLVERFERLAEAVGRPAPRLVTAG
jgi:geranylgeranyl diphosphate synthase, type II